MSKEYTFEFIWEKEDFFNILNSYPIQNSTFLTPHSTFLTICDIQPTLQSDFASPYPT